MRRLGMLLLVLMFTARPAAAQEQELVADLADHLVAITTGFAGTDVLLFGAVDQPGDVLVVVRGPSRPETVRRKQRVAGIWINMGEARLTGAPIFYRLAASGPVAEIAPPEVRQRYEIGYDALNIQGRDDSPAYRAALIRLKQRHGLYGDQVQPVVFLGNRLFRTRVHIPANVPTGSYVVEVYLLRDGAVVGVQKTPLVVSKVGLGARISEFAHRRSALYGIVAIAVAVGSGWLAAVLFRKG